LGLMEVSLWLQDLFDLHSLLLVRFLIAL